MDPFESHSTTLIAPAGAGAAITPNDGSDLPVRPRAIWVGQEGDLALTLEGGATVVLAGVAGGTLLPVRPVRVRQSGTTAGALVGLW